MIVSIDIGANVMWSCFSLAIALISYAAYKYGKK